MAWWMILIAAFGWFLGITGWALIFVVAWQLSPPKELTAEINRTKKEEK